MSNIGWVETERKIVPEEVTNLLNRLNETKFRNQFIIIPGTGWSDKGYGWQVNHKDNEDLYGSRFYTIDEGKDHTIETEHKGGGDHWMWWVDGEILNEIAVVFGGKVHDEGGDKSYSGVPGGQSWEDHLKERWKWCLEEGREYPAFIKEFTPPAFTEGIKFESREREEEIVFVSNEEWQKINKSENP
jgi:hypothetical protein